jgi:hypothetical protein
METEFRPTRVVEIETKWSKQSEARRAARYLVLPPLKEMAAAAKLPGKALALLLLIHHRQRMLECAWALKVQRPACKTPKKARHER